MGKPRPEEVSTAWSDAAPGPPGHGLTPHSGVWLLRGPLVTSAGAEGVTTPPPDSGDSSDLGRNPAQGGARAPTPLSPAGPGNGLAVGAWGKHRRAPAAATLGLRAQLQSGEHHSVHLPLGPGPVGLHLQVPPELQDQMMTHVTHAGCMSAPRLRPWRLSPASQWGPRGHLSFHGWS